MLIVARGRYNPELVEEVQRFRGAVYDKDGAVCLVDGRHIDPKDTDDCFHLVEIRGGIAGCVRYKPAGLRDAHASIGGWAVGEEHRHTRVGVKLALGCVRLAELLGDTCAMARATVKHNSADILKRLGGRSLASYYDEDYSSQMELIEFRLEAMRRPLQKAA